ncbi:MULTISPECIES: hypothetical protein [unclassified Mesorhizobium]|nr:MULTISPECIES: hypothetical protein [unclassified Mesorhizobium]
MDGFKGIQAENSVEWNELLAVHAPVRAELRRPLQPNAMAMSF